MEESFWLHTGEEMERGKIKDRETSCLVFATTLARDKDGLN